MRSSGESLVVQAALARGFLTQAQLQAAQREEAALSAQGRSPGLLAVLGQRYLSPAQTAELRRVYQSASGQVSASDVTHAADSSVRPGYVSPEEITRAGPESAYPPAGSGISAAFGGETGRWAPGAQVGEWLLDKKLGQGGMGAVFLAHHLQTGAASAIKAISLQASTTSKERFRREGAAMASVDRHPNVLRVHSAGEALGHMYLVMDVASGGDLKERIEREGPLPLPEAARLLADVARGLAHVHAHGILHRDLKPANILFDDAGTPLVVDFGLARSEDWESLTRTGAMVGTPAYMPPEQVRGQKGKVDERSDVYGLGAVLYHVLTGEAPLEADSMPGLIAAILSTDPAPPSQRHPDLDPAGDRVALKALAKLPEDRYPTAVALAEDLERLARGEEVDVRAPSRITLLRRRVQKRRGLYSLGAIGVLALLLLGGLLVHRAVRPSGPSQAETAALAAAQAALTLARDSGRQVRFAQGAAGRLTLALEALRAARTELQALESEPAARSPAVVEALGELDASEALLAFDAAVSARALEKATRLLEALSPGPQRQLRAAALAQARGQGAPHLARLAAGIAEPTASAEVYLLATKAALGAGDRQQAADYLERVGVEALAPYRDTIRADLLLEQADQKITQLDPAAVQLIQQAASLDAKHTRRRLAGLVATALARAKQDPPAKVARVLEALEGSCGAVLPRAAARIYLRLAAAREEALDWNGLGEHLVRARRIDPDLELPDSLGLNLVAQGNALVNRGQLRKGYEVLLIGTRVGIKPDIKRRSLERLRAAGSMDALVQQNPRDWAARYWRAVTELIRVRGVTDRRKRKQILQQIQADVELVAEAPRPGRFRLEALVLRLRHFHQSRRLEELTAFAEQAIKANARLAPVVAYQVGFLGSTDHRLEDAVRWLDRGEALEAESRRRGAKPLADWQRRVRVRGWVGVAQLALGRKNVRLARRAVDLALKAPDPPPELSALVCRVIWLEGHPRRALAQADQALARQETRYLLRVRYQLLEALGDPRAKEAKARYEAGRRRRRPKRRRLR